MSNLYASQEIGKCKYCGYFGAINRKYYYYGIECECHSPEHFEMVYHCNDCEPKPPVKTTIHMKPKEE